MPKTKSRDGPFTSRALSCVAPIPRPLLATPQHGARGAGAGHLQGHQADAASRAQGQPLRRLLPLPPRQGQVQPGAPLLPLPPPQAGRPLHPEGAAPVPPSARPAPPRPPAPRGPPRAARRRRNPAQPSQQTVQQPRSRECQRFSSLPPGLHPTFDAESADPAHTTRRHAHRFLPRRPV